MLSIYIDIRDLKRHANELLDHIRCSRPVSAIHMSYQFLECIS